MKIIMIMLIIACTKNNFIYNNKYKNDIEYYFNNLDKLNENAITYVIEKAEEGDYKALFLYIYLLNRRLENQQLESKIRLLENTNNLIECLHNNNEFKALGELYHHGVEGQLEPDVNKAIEYYTKAIDMGYSASTFILGNLYHYGIEEKLEPNANKAIEYYTKAIDMGDSSAAFHLGLLYQYPIEGQLESNANKAIEYYTKAIDMGNSSVVCILGNLYHYGIEGQLEPNINKAIEYYTEAMNMGNSSAACILGNLYHYGIKGQLETNVNKALEYYNKAIDMGDSSAAFNIGELYQYGIKRELEPDVNKAIEYYTKAMDMGSSHAKYCLESLYNKLIKDKLHMGINETIKCAFYLYSKYNYKHNIILKTFTLNSKIEDYDENECKSTIETYTNNIKECYGIVLERKMNTDINSTVSFFKHSPINSDLYLSYDYICNYLESLLDILKYFDNHNFMINCIKVKDKSKFKNDKDDYVNVLDIKGNEYLCLGVYDGYKKLVDIINGKKQFLGYIDKAISNVDNNNLYKALNEIVNIETQLYDILIYFSYLRNNNFKNKYEGLFNN